MATITAFYQSDEVLSNSSFKPFPSGTLGIRKATFNLTAALALNNLVQMVPVYKGETVYGVTLNCTELDTNGSPTLTLDVGYGGGVAVGETSDPATADDFINGATTGAAAQSFTHSIFSSDDDAVDAFAGTGSVGVEFTADDTIDVLCKTANATGATTGTITVSVLVA